MSGKWRMRLASGLWSGVLTVLLSAQLTGCAWVGLQQAPEEETLAQLPAVQLPPQEETIPELGLAELASAYSDVLDTNTEPVIRLQVEQRLADIKLRQAEGSLAENEPGLDEDLFAPSIAAYQALLREHPDNPANDQLLYQLSRAYDLGGSGDQSFAVLQRLRNEYPASVHIPEAEFRLAESHFVAARYGSAEQSYARVIVYGEATPYFLKALYMQGWSRFKQGDYQGAIEPFTVTLDRVVPADNNLQTLPRGERELAQDGMRALAVIFSYLDGVQSITQAYDDLGVRSYQPLLYEQLGDLYLTQERFRDSAQAYKSSTSRFPDSSHAPRFQLRVIQAYEAGGFPDLVVQEKQHYVQQFAVAGKYWEHADGTQREQISGPLQQFIEELASHYHALAQSEGRPDGNRALASEHYLAAGNYYQQFIDSFPRNSQVPAMGFLLGETQFEVGNFVAALTVYEWVAYEFNTYERAADAAYAALLAYERLHENGAAPLRHAYIKSERRFATHFASDMRAVPVLAHAANALLQMEEYVQAIAVADTLINWLPAPDIVTQTSAWLMRGDGLFAMARYATAEQAYQSGLALMSGDDERHTETLELVAASIYQQGEAALATGDTLAAAQQFARVLDVAPHSRIRANAQFDAATNYIQAQRLEQANVLLLDFRRRFQAHELTADVAMHLVDNYEKLEQWQNAAVELDVIAATQPAGEAQRQALYLAADYYERAGEVALAIARFRRYANTWPQPAIVRMEAIHSLAQLYDGAAQPQKQRYWLRQLMVAHADPMNAPTEFVDRSTYLAAHAASILADDAYQDFSAIALGLPMKASLARKKSAMETALAAYQKTQTYGVQQFSTLATYRTGRIYQQLSTDLLQSERPGGLGALALDEYAVLLEEQAFPFEEKAIAIYESNTALSRDGLYDEWIKESFVALAQLLPARYHKREERIGFSQEIY